MDESTGNTPNTDQTSDATENTTTGQDGTQPNSAESRTVPYSRFQEINAKYRELANWKTQQETEAAKAKGEFEKLYTESQAELNTLKSRLMRRDVAAAKNLPIELADRLAGETEEELAADAERLLQFLKPSKPAAPNIDGNTKGSELPVFTTSQIADNEFYRKNREAILRAQREGRIVEG